MTPSALLAARNARPFTPFRIVMVNGKTPDVLGLLGESIDVLAPEMMLVGVTAVYVGTPHPTISGAYDRIDLLSIDHIARLEPIASPCVVVNPGASRPPAAPKHSFSFHTSRLPEPIPPPPPPGYRPKPPEK